MICIILIPFWYSLLLPLEYFSCHSASSAVDSKPFLAILIDTSGQSRRRMLSGRSTIATAILSIGGSLRK